MVFMNDNIEKERYRVYFRSATREYGSCLWNFIPKWKSPRYYVVYDLEKNEIVKIEGDDFRLLVIATNAQGREVR